MQSLHQLLSLWDVVLPRFSVHLKAHGLGLGNNNKVLGICQKELIFLACKLLNINIDDVQDMIASYSPPVNKWFGPDDDPEERAFLEVYVIVPITVCKWFRGYSMFGCREVLYDIERMCVDGRELSTTERRDQFALMVLGRYFRCAMKKGVIPADERFCHIKDLIPENPYGAALALMDRSKERVARASQGFSTPLRDTDPPFDNYALNKLYQSCAEYVAKCDKAAKNFKYSINEQEVIVNICLALEEDQKYLAAEIAIMYKLLRSLYRVPRRDIEYMLTLLHHVRENKQR